MDIRPTTVKKLMREAVRNTNLLISSHAYQYLSVKLQELAEDITKKAENLLNTENEFRKTQGLEPLKKLTDRHLKEVMEDLEGDNV